MSVEFADVIVSVAVVGHTIRLELGVRGRKDKESPESIRVTNTLVMPIDGFANSFIPLKELMERLEKDGVIKPREAAPKTPSPNFQ